MILLGKDLSHRSPNGFDWIVLLGALVNVLVVTFLFAYWLTL